MNKNKTDYIIVGDVNIDFLKYNLVTNVTNYANCLNSVGCSVFVDKPTRVTNNTATCIDHVYSSMHAENLDNYIVLSDASDHFSTLTKIMDIDKSHADRDIFYRKCNLSPIEGQNFNDELQAVLGSLSMPRNMGVDANFLANSILDAYYRAINKFMPLIKLPKGQSRPIKPCITKG